MEDPADSIRVMPPASMCAGDFVLRAFRESDWEVEAELSRDPDVVRWTFYPDGMDEQAARDRLRHHEKRVAEGATRRFVVLDKEERPLGTCGIGKLQHETPELFFALLRSGRGRGAATQAVLSMAQWAFGSGRDSVALVTVNGNQPSVAVARRTGFRAAEQFEDDHRGEPAMCTRWLLDHDAG